MDWYNELALILQERLAAIDTSSVLSSPLEISSRPKTIDTLRQKLQRDRSTPLPKVQDIAGIRMEAEMSLGQQDSLVAIVVNLMSDFEPRIRDLRSSPHSGYRAVHVWVRAYGGPAEIQVRTHLQGAWANAYEAAGDAFGREIRYGQLPTEPEAARLVRYLQEISTDQIASFERRRPPNPGPDITLIENEFRERFASLRDALGSFRIES